MANETYHQFGNPPTQTFDQCTTFYKTCYTCYEMNYAPNPNLFKYISSQ